MEKLKNSFRLISHSAVLALGASFQCYATYRTFFIYPNVGLIVVLGLLTLGAYLFYPLVIKHQWYTLFLVVFVGSFFVLTRIYKNSFDSTIFFLLGIISSFVIAYFIPLLGSKSIRQIPYLKIFFIALIWTIVCVLLPLYNQSWLWSSIGTKVGLLCLSKFLFVVAITLPFDIRDIETDSDSRIKTLPVLLGENKSRYLALLTWNVSLLLTLLIEKDTADFIIRNVLMMILGNLLLFNCQKQNSAIYYLGLDGLLFVQGILWLWC